MPDRRQFLRMTSGVAFATVAGAPLAAREVVDLDWNDLMPDGAAKTLLQDLRALGIVPHGALVDAFDPTEAQVLTEDFNGRTVRLPGFVVPLDFDGTDVTSFILAPFIGGCVHVPPPPANQLVLVTPDRPTPFEALYDPVVVTGTFASALPGDAMTEIGYHMTAERITPVA